MVHNYHASIGIYLLLTGICLYMKRNNAIKCLVAIPDFNLFSQIQPFPDAAVESVPDIPRAVGIVTRMSLKCGRG